MSTTSLSSRATCVNLKERFGRRYKILHEESYLAQYGPRARTDDPWLQIIPCARGPIYPHGFNILAASTNSRGPTAGKLAALDFATVHQDGSDGVTILFPGERSRSAARKSRIRHKNAGVDSLAAGHYRRS